MLTKRHSFSKLALVFFVLFLDLLSFSAVIPIIPPLFFASSGLLPFASAEMRYILLGALLATYPLAQIFSGPVLGTISDETSRRRVLLISFTGNFFGYASVALGIAYNSLLLVFLGNAFAGLLGGNIPTINAIIADLSTPYTKAKRYGLSNMIFGLAFVLGPYVISHLTSPNPVVLFFICALVAVTNFFLIFLFFREKETHNSLVYWKSHLSIHHVLGCTKILKQLLLSAFLLFFGWYFFIKFFQVFLFQQFSYSSQQFSQLLSYFGACCVATQLLFVFFLHKLAGPKRFLLIFLFVLALSIFSLLFVASERPLVLVVTLFSVSYSLIAPCFIAVISNAEESESQGKIMGLYQSIQALAKVLAPTAAGLTVALQAGLPLFISGSAILLSGILFFFVKNSPKISVSS